MKVAIIGPGRVGMTLAYTLVLKGLVTELVLVGGNPAKARGEAMDLNHSLLFLRTPVKVSAGEIADVAGSEVIAICASVPMTADLQDRNQLAAANIELMRTLVPAAAAAAPQAIFLILSNPVDVLTWQALRLTGLPATRVIGSGTLIDSARYRDALSMQVGIHPDDIRSYVLGEHGDTQFVAMSLAQSGAEPLDDTPARRKLFSESTAAGFQVFKLKGNTCYAVALAASVVIEAILLDEKRTMPLSIAINGYCGVHNVCLSVPVVVGRGGIERVLQPPLNEAEQAAFRRSAAAVRAVIDATGVADG
ncbi:malate dehydrogenase [Synoicihabitans lomoniglobus]|uniref:L-lactate dehydrogenase n=1 Tax=Synoicihabitans lomoniglobus TaxID=2909285 RepID=A0AAE9ZRU3_9BACT|nr:hypothetical protein [Opitutaceae bacterium LMO-M01]WED63027.1 hypothetical protein PXH66_11850 [Opitutaceae bacterium LMO-M01]